MTEEEEEEERIDRRTKRDETVRCKGHSLDVVAFDAAPPAANDWPIFLSSEKRREK